MAGDFRFSRDQLAEVLTRLQVKVPYDDLLSGGTIHINAESMADGIIEGLTDMGCVSE